VLLQRVAGMIANARALPLSSSVKLDNKDEILELLREAIERLPEELRQARWMLKEREEFLAATQRRADELVEAARSEAQRLVQRTEILKEAQAQARRALEEAGDEARRLRLEAEDYADQKLAQFEIVLERTMKTVASGRQKLSGLPDKDEELSGAPFEGAGAGAGPAGAPGMGGAAGMGGPAPMGMGGLVGLTGPIGVGRAGAGVGGGSGMGGSPGGLGNAVGDRRRLGVRVRTEPREGGLLRSGQGAAGPGLGTRNLRTVYPPSSPPGGAGAGVATGAGEAAGDGSWGGEDGIFDQDSLE